MEKLEIIINEMVDDGPVPMDLGNVGTHDARATHGDQDVSNDTSYGTEDKELMNGRVAKRTMEERREARGIHHEQEEEGEIGAQKGRQRVRARLLRAHASRHRCTNQVQTYSSCRWRERKKQVTFECSKLFLTAGGWSVVDRSQLAETVRPQHDELCECQFVCDSALSAKSDGNGIELKGETDDGDMEDEETGRVRR